MLSPLYSAYDDDDAGLPVSSSDQTAYTHDGVGNLTAIDRPGEEEDRYLAYSAWSQLISASATPGGSDITYTLDALDRVIERTSGGLTASYTYQGTGEVLASSEVSGTATTYAHTPGGPLAQQVTGTLRYFLRDEHGDLVGWANTSGGLVGTALFDPWGQVLQATGEMAASPAQGAFGFQSDLTDAETGQVDMAARWYEPSLGRFSSRDPLFGNPTEPASNQFVHAGANPITFSDPSGLAFEVGTGGGCGRACTKHVLEEAQIDVGAVLASFADIPALEAPGQPLPSYAFELAYRPVATNLYDWFGTTGAHNHVVDALEDHLCRGEPSGSAVASAGQRSRLAPGSGPICSTSRISLSTRSSPTSSPGFLKHAGKWPGIWLG